MLSVDDIAHGFAGKKIWGKGKNKMREASVLEFSSARMMIILVECAIYTDFRKFILAGFGHKSKGINQNWEAHTGIRRKPHSSV